MKSYIDDYVGEWDDECGRHLCIEKLDDETALVSLFVNRQPFPRPWYDDQLSTEMIGTCYPPEGLVVELWKKGKGFTLHLDFEPQFELDELNRDALAVGLSRYEEDHFLGQYYPLFGRLRHYVKTAA